MLEQKDIDIKYNLRPFEDPPVTKIDVQALRLQSLDLSLFKDGDEFLEQRKELANLLEKGISTSGFFNLVNFGIEPKQIERLRSIAQSILELPESVQHKYLAGAIKKEDEDPNVSIGAERAQGFKPKGYWPIKDGVRDSIVFYNFRDITKENTEEEIKRHPEIIQEYFEEIGNYYKTLRNVVQPKLLRLCDLILQIPEGSLQKYFDSSENNEDRAGSRGRFMMYQPYENENLAKQADSTFLRGHSDLGGFTYITSQPVLSLQIKDYFTGDWKYVDHVPGSLIVNVGDALEFISGGLFKACIHRVVQPPLDQRNSNRLVLIYFCSPNENSPLYPHDLNSPRLKELGLTKEDKLKDWEDIQFKHWNDIKGKVLGRRDAGTKNLLKFHGRSIERWHHIANDSAKSTTSV